MTRPLTPAQLRAMEPRYTIGGLFESGTLGAGDETALAEIASIRNAFARWVNPSRGWFSPRGGGGGSSPPRPLASGQIWRRYTHWRKRWSERIVPPSPSIPWGLTVADVVVLLVTEPVDFAHVAELTKGSSLSVVQLFVRSVQDYGREAGQARQAFWREWDGVGRQLAAKQTRNRRMKDAARSKRYRQKKRHAENPKN